MNDRSVNASETGNPFDGLKVKDFFPLPDMNSRHDAYGIPIKPERGDRWAQASSSSPQERGFLSRAFAKAWENKGTIIAGALTSCFVRYGAVGLASTAGLGVVTGAIGAAAISGFAVANLKLGIEWYKDSSQEKTIRGFGHYWLANKRQLMCSTAFATLGGAAAQYLMPLAAEWGSEAVSAVRSSGWFAAVVGKVSSWVGQVAEGLSSVSRSLESLEENTGSAIPAPAGVETVNLPAADGGQARGGATTGAIEIVYDEVPSTAPTTVETGPVIDEPPAEDPLANLLNAMSGAPNDETASTSADFAATSPPESAALSTPEPAPEPAPPAVVPRLEDRVRDVLAQSRPVSDKWRRAAELAIMEQPSGGVTQADINRARTDLAMALQWGARGFPRDVDLANALREDVLSRPDPSIKARVDDALNRVRGWSGQRRDVAGGVDALKKLAESSDYAKRALDHALGKPRVAPVSSGGAVTAIQNQAAAVRPAFPAPGTPVQIELGQRGRDGVWRGVVTGLPEGTQFTMTVR